MQRPLWASTSTKNPDYPDTKYLDELIGPDTVTTVNSTIDAFQCRGAVARTIDLPTHHAVDTLNQLHEVGIDLDEVGAALETRGIERFRADQQSAIDTLAAKVGELTATRSTQP